MVKPTPEDVRRALNAYRHRDQGGHERLLVHAHCVADELGRLLFADPDECASTAAASVHYMLGYLQAAADLLGTTPGDLVRALTHQ